MMTRSAPAAASIATPAGLINACPMPNRIQGSKRVRTSTRPPKDKYETLRPRAADS